MPARLREEVLNVILALLLNKRGIVAAPEQILRSAVENKRVMPDVLVDYLGLRMAIEGKIGFTPAARKGAIDAARGRVECGVAYIAIAVLYPSSLAKVVQMDQLEEDMGAANLTIAIVTEAEEAMQLVLPLQDFEPMESSKNPEWIESDVDHLGSVLRRAYDSLVAENVVENAVRAIKAGIEGFSPVILNSPGAVARARNALGIRAEEINNPPEQEDVSDG